MIKLKDKKTQACPLVYFVLVIMKGLISRERRFSMDLDLARAVHTCP